MTDTMTLKAAAEALDYTEKWMRIVLQRKLVKGKLVRRGRRLVWAVDAESVAARLAKKKVRNSVGASVGASVCEEEGGGK